MAMSASSLSLGARLRAIRSRAIAIVSAATLGACYDYLPMPSGDPQPGLEVRAMLTDAGSLQLSPFIGPRVSSLDGTIVRADRDSLVLRVKSLTLMSGEENGWSGERLAVPASAVASLRTKQLSRTRTTLAALVATGGVVAIIAGNHGGGDPASGGVIIPPTGQYRGP